MIFNNFSSLVATVSAEPIKSPLIVSTTVNERSSDDNGSYFVYCKSCKDLKQGKLRIHCGICKSNAVLLYVEPNDWSDLYDCGPLMAFCHDCDVERKVNVLFKCKDCDDVCFKFYLSTFV